MAEICKGQRRGHPKRTAQEGPTTFLAVPPGDSGVVWEEFSLRHLPRLDQPPPSHWLVGRLSLRLKTRSPRGFARSLRLARGPDGSNQPKLHKGTPHYTRRGDCDALFSNLAKNMGNAALSARRALRAFAQGAHCKEPGA